MSAKEGMGAKDGDKIFAATHADGDHVYFLGFGIYKGTEIPGEDVVGMMGSLLRMREQENPKLVLDSGEVIYGCECYWGPADQFRSFSNMRKVVQVTVAEFREAANKPKSKEAT